MAIWGIMWPHLVHRVHIWSLKVLESLEKNKNCILGQSLEKVVNFVIMMNSLQKQDLGRIIFNSETK